MFGALCQHASRENQHFTKLLFRELEGTFGMIMGRKIHFNKRFSLRCKRKREGHFCYVFYVIQVLDLPRAPTSIVLLTFLNARPADLNITLCKCLASRDDCVGRPFRLMS